MCVCVVCVRMYGARTRTFELWSVVRLKRIGAYFALSLFLIVSAQNWANKALISFTAAVCITVRGNNSGPQEFFLTFHSTDKVCKGFDRAPILLPVTYSNIEAVHVAADGLHFRNTLYHEIYE